MPDVKEAASRLADRLLADLQSGALPALDLVEVEKAGRQVIEAAHLDQKLYRSLVDWTIKYVIERSPPDTRFSLKH